VRFGGLNEKVIEPMDFFFWGVYRVGDSAVGLLHHSNFTTRAYLLTGSGFGVCPVASNKTGMMNMT